MIQLEELANKTIASHGKQMILSIAPVENRVDVYFNAFLRMSVGIPFCNMFYFVNQSTTIRSLNRAIKLGLGLEVEDPKYTLFGNFDGNIRKLDLDSSVLSLRDAWERTGSAFFQFQVSTEVLNQSFLGLNFAGTLIQFKKNRFLTKRASVYCVIKGTSLFIYTSDRNLKSAKEIKNCNEANIDYIGPFGPNTFQFSISVPNKNYIFACFTESGAKEWVNALRSCTPVTEHRFPEYGQTVKKKLHKIKSVSDVETDDTCDQSVSGDGISSTDETLESLQKKANSLFGKRKTVVTSLNRQEISQKSQNAPAKLDLDESPSTLIQKGAGSLDEEKPFNHLEIEPLKISNLTVLKKECMFAETEYCKGKPVKVRSLVSAHSEFINAIIQGKEESSSSDSLKEMKDCTDLLKRICEYLIQEDRNPELLKAHFREYIKRLKMIETFRELDIKENGFDQMLQSYNSETESEFDLVEDEFINDQSEDIVNPCIRCHESVSFATAVYFKESVFHKTCFMCANCKSRPTKAILEQGNIFCSSRCLNLFKAPSSVDDVIFAYSKSTLK